VFIGYSRAIFEGLTKKHDARKSVNSHLSVKVKYDVDRDAGKSIIGGQIFIYSCSASFISFESDCFYSL
jgi:hypothetical protein